MNNLNPGITCLSGEKTLPTKGRVSRIIQIHPSLKCNLTCKHCYSGSSPQYKNSLDADKLKRIIAELAPEGYNVISLSGGEPFLYRPLDELLQYSKTLHYFNSVTTNAMLLKTAHARQILKYADLIAISLDGNSQQHDTIRNFNGAFDKMIEGIKIVKDNVARFGFINTLFPDSWQMMLWLTEFALTHEAKLLHFHPLEIVGRAIGFQKDVFFDDYTLHKIYIAFHYLKQYHSNDIVMQLDLLHRDNMKDNPDFFFPATDINAFYFQEFSEICKELIIDEDGDIIPIAHGCSKYFKIGNINEERPVKEMIEGFLNDKMHDLIKLYNSTYETILADEEKELFNWSEIVIQNSHDMFKEHTDEKALL